MVKKHNRTWFRNRKKVYCDDHPNKNITWEECEGIIIDSDVVVENLLKSQNERGVIFTATH